ncbi:MAG: hypothetical protein Q4D80_06365 [Pseudomonadota bacterium]|nr:hypothetical protein [Pseudomonadota bacterium]
MAESASGSVKYILSTIKSSFLPALLFAGGMVVFFAQNPYIPEVTFTFHTAFYILAFLGVTLLCIVNRSKPFFSLITGIVSYIFLNWSKNKYGTDYQSCTEYLWICFALPLNLLLFYYLDPHKLQSKIGFWLSVFLLGQLFFIQHCGNIIRQIPYLNLNFGNMPMIAAALWFLIFMPVAIDISIKNTRLNTGLFYADACLFMGLMYSGNVSAVTTFFLCFALILFATTLTDLYHQYNYDILENVGSYNSYLNHANSRFPYKYTIGLFSIDNRDKLLKILGSRKMQELEQMLVNRIRDFPYDISVYRYLNPEELIMVFKNEDAKHTMEYADNIRHVIAASEFFFTNGKSIKITISASVSEKTRLDLNATSVTTRAHNALQKAYRFNCNIVTKA